MAGCEKFFDVTKIAPHAVFSFRDVGFVTHVVAVLHLEVGGMAEHRAGRSAWPQLPAIRLPLARMGKIAAGCVGGFLVVIDITKASSWLFCQLVRLGFAHLVLPTSMYKRAQFCTCLKL